ncbi:mediator of RNA polymerase II transcription subunit 25-like [Teleopsis dalmanni]|uniref:mediator of RNA polymerase II transcription subunit 25-like n=1 Tax=Teleopsis dalmanni TaxID=139649 RepID=UPI0018CD0EBB|nr:mediator of RNA polymerase II transcription subunit 25-like [Teleopsis dalmanni]
MSVRRVANLTARNLAMDTAENNQQQELYTAPENVNIVQQEGRPLTEANGTREMQENEVVPVSPLSTSETCARTREREMKWIGKLKWYKMSKRSGQKITRTALCAISLGPGNPVVKCNRWAKNITLQLIPKDVVGNISRLTEDCEEITFNVALCNAFHSLAKRIKEFVGCVYFKRSTTRTAGDIMVALILCARVKDGFLGFIPKNDSMIVERLRKYIQLVQMAENTNAVGNSNIMHST